MSTLTSSPNFYIGVSLSRCFQLTCKEAMQLLCLFLVMFASECSSELHLSRAPHGDHSEIMAQINITSKDIKSGKEASKLYKGLLGQKSEVHTISGILMLVTSKSIGRASSKQDHFGCGEYTNKNFPRGKWIALVERGACDFNIKIKIASDNNASAVVIFNNVSGVGAGSYKWMHHDSSGVVSVFITQDIGKDLEKKLESGSVIHMTIVPDVEGLLIQHHIPAGISSTSVLFVSISFIVLMVISLTWLLFYYIQRFRYFHARERLARRLACAAKKAIAKTPQKTLKGGDGELDTDFDACAVCIEPYKVQDVVRVLPCRHVFHKACVDPWLLDQRSCPMCKADILRAYGMQIGGSQGSEQPDAEMIAQNTINEEQELSSSIEEVHSEHVKVLIPQACSLYKASSLDRNKMSIANSSEADQDGACTSSNVTGAVTPEDDKKHIPVQSSLKSIGKSSRAEKIDEKHDALEMTSLIDDSDVTRITLAGYGTQANQTDAIEEDESITPPKV